MTEIIASVLIATLTALVGSILFIAIIAFPFQWLWNAIVVVVFGGPRVDYVQAAGLLALAALTTAATNGMRIALKFRSRR